MIYIILPVHNEANTIIKTASDLFTWCSANLGNHKIIFVNDHSTDGTDGKLHTISSALRLMVLSNDLQPGKGQALKYGFDLMSRSFNMDSEDIVIFMDGDGQIRPRDIKPLLNILYVYDADAAIGNKRHLFSLAEYGPMRFIVSKTFNCLTKILLGIPFSDTQCGLKAFKFHALNNVIHKVKSNKYAFDAELLMGLRIAKYRVVDSPITLGEQLNAGSVSLKSIFETLKDTGGIYINSCKRRLQL